MPVNYDIQAPTPGAPRNQSPTETQLMADIADTIQDIGTRLDTRGEPEGLAEYDADGDVLSADGTKALAGVLSARYYDGTAWAARGVASDQPVMWVAFGYPDAPMPPEFVAGLDFAFASA